MFAVAPSAGAWIEIITDKQKLDLTNVAPSAGAWIEIAFDDTKGKMQDLSLPPRERGLK